MIPFSPPLLILSTISATLLAYKAWKKPSLTPSGCIAAWIVGFLLFSTGPRGYLLLVFYQISIWASRYRREIKEKLSKDSELRGVSQVLACSGLATLLSLWYAYDIGAEVSVEVEDSLRATVLTCAVLCHHATCLADTLASEMGILSRSSPRLITAPWKSVPPGTNGGITVSGCGWSLLGGFLIAVAFVFLDFVSGVRPIPVARILLFGSLCGLLGSLLDSLLGATVQTSYYEKDEKRVYQRHDRPATAIQIAGIVDLLNNEQVNFVSVILTCWLGGWVLGPLLFFHT